MADGSFVVERDDVRAVQDVGQPLLDRVRSDQRGPLRPLGGFEIDVGKLANVDLPFTAVREQQRWRCRDDPLRAEVIGEPPNAVHPTAGRRRR